MFVSVFLDGDKCFVDGTSTLSRLDLLRRTKGNKIMSGNSFKTNKKIKLHRGSPVFANKKLSKRMERSYSLAFLQNKFCYKANSGFISVLLLPLISLMITGMIGLTMFSVGIKNITKVQSYCIQISLKGQKELGQVLTKLLSLNSKVLSLHKARQAISASIAGAGAMGLLHLIPPLQKKKEMIKQMQSLLIIKQNHLLAQSRLIKMKTLKQIRKQLKELFATAIGEEPFYKKALAVQKQKIGDKAYTYKPMSDFVDYQKTRFRWKIQTFYPLNKNQQWMFFIPSKSFSSHTCTASLKQKGEQWISILYH